MRGRLNVKNFCLRKIRKIRHRKGYGVHSPFAYNLITKVIEEKSGYYAYQQIEGLHRILHDKQSLNKRRYRLLFRLTNRFKPQTIIEGGSEGGYSTLYLQKGCPTAQHFCIEPDPIKRAAAEQLLMRLPGKVTYINASIADGLSFLSEKRGATPLHIPAPARRCPSIRGRLRTNCTAAERNMHSRSRRHQTVERDSPLLGGMGPERKNPRHVRPLHAGHCQLQPQTQ